MTDAAAPSDETVDILTHGCRLNAYESEVMRDHARTAGLRNAVIVNTCAVTGEAIRQARQSIRRARRERPDASIIVTGCAAQIDPTSFSDMPEVSQVIGNAEKLQVGAFNTQTTGDDAPKRVQVSDIMSVRSPPPRHLVDGLDGRARAFVQVQTGCNHRCTFCVIPFGRGNSRSTDLDTIIDQVRRLHERGHVEVVLTGVDLTSWGDDLPGAPTLGNLVDSILRQAPDLRQLRLSSLDAIEIDDRLFDLLVNEPRIAPHLHLSFQSGDDMVLKRMKRRHSRQDAIDLCQRIRAARPEIAFGADLIAGFPTETEEMFQNTLDSVDACELDYLHVFPFSPRPGTPASRMPQVDTLVIRERAARLREKGRIRLALRLDRHVGSTALALIESRGRARLPDFAPVLIDGPTPNPGQLVRLHMTGRTDNELTGRVA
jgi:threonylcarbamoyladenosine tRNA methylthiotransferase MtaB